MINKRYHFLKCFKINANNCNTRLEIGKTLPNFPSLSSSTMACLMSI
jgi:hypothetical protein